MSKQADRAAVVIPALNEETSLPGVIEALDESCDVVVVDDGSTDATAAVARAAGAHVLRHDRNRGYDCALTSGLEYARRQGYGCAVTIDADGQIPPQLVMRVLTRLASGEIDLVLGRRERKARWSESLYSAYTCRRYGVADILCGLKGYRLAAFHALPDLNMRDSIGTAVALAGLRAGLHWEEVAVPTRPRIGASRFGAGMRSNLRILRAMLHTVGADLAARPARSP